MCICCDTFVAGHWPGSFLTFLESKLKEAGTFLFNDFFVAAAKTRYYYHALVIKIKSNKPFFLHTVSSVWTCPILVEILSVWLDFSASEEVLSLNLNLIIGVSISKYNQLIKNIYY